MQFIIDIDDENIDALAELIAGKLGTVAPAPKAKGKAAPAEEEEPEEPEAEEEGETADEGPELYTLVELEALSRDDLKAVAEANEIEFGDRTKSSILIDKILAAQEPEEEEAEPEAEEEPEAEAEETDEEETEEPGETAEEEGEFWTREELEPMSLGELKAVARDYGLETTGKKSPDLIAAILGE
jgi:hypothetical protein